LPTQPIVSVHFDFYGESFDPDAITQRLGIEPTTHFRAGDPMSLGTGHRKRDRWILTVGDKEVLHIDDMLKELRGAINVSPQEIRNVCSELAVEAVVTCMVLPQPPQTPATGSPQMPSMEFPPDFVEWVASLGARLSIDVMTIAYDDE
jgi:hypothetical protein